MSNEKDKEKGKASNLPHGMMDRSFGEKEKINSEATQVAEKDLEKGKSVKVLNPPRGMVMSIGEKENLRDFLKEKRNLQQVLEKQLLMFPRSRVINLIIPLHLPPRLSLMLGSHPKTTGLLRDGSLLKKLQGVFGLFRSVVG